MKSYKERLDDAHVEVNKRMQELYEKKQYNAVEKLKVLIKVAKEHNVISEDLI